MPSPEFDPSTVIVAKVLELQSKVPFKPYVIVTSSGESYEVPTADHLTVMRISRKIVLEYDDYRTRTINPLHITSIVEHPGAAA